MPPPITLRRDLSLRRNTSANIAIGITRDAITNEVMDLSAGYTARGVLASRQGVAILQLSSDDETIVLGADGSVRIVLTPAQIPDLLRYGVWDMRLEDGSGGSYLLAFGTADILPTVTPLDPP